MATDPTPAQLEALAVAPYAPHALAVGFGAGADVDAAFDAAAAESANVHGSTGAHPSLALADPSRIQVVPGATPLPAPAVALAVADFVADAAVPAGVLHAWPVTTPAAFTRRRARVTITDPALAPLPVGRLVRLDPAWRQAIGAALADAGTPLGDGELVESVDVVRHRARYKPVVSVNRGKSTATFAVLDPRTDRLISTGHRTAGEARRAAVALAKSGPVTTSGPDPDVADLHVVKVTTREGLPFVHVARTRVASTTVLKVAVIAAKESARGPRVTGWVFAGTPDQGDRLEDQASED